MFKPAVVVVTVHAALAAIGCGGRKAVNADKPRLNTHLSLPDVVLNPTATETTRSETFLFGSGQCPVCENEADADIAITTTDNLARTAPARDNYLAWRDGTFSAGIGLGLTAASAYTWNAFDAFHRRGTPRLE